TQSCEILRQIGNEVWRSSSEFFVLVISQRRSANPWSGQSLEDILHSGNDRVDDMFNVSRYASFGRQAIVAEFRYINQLATSLIEICSHCLQALRELYCRPTHRVPS